MRHILLAAVLAVAGHAAWAGADESRKHPPTAAARSIVDTATAELLIFLAPKTDVNTFAREHGLTVRYALQSDPDAYVFAAGTIQAATAALPAVSTDARVAAAYANRRSLNERMAFVPNDPYFHRDTPSWGWPGQWHLVNEWVTGRDARVQGAWNRDLTGSGVVIGICDDGLETAHPDLAPNYRAADSWDFGENDSDPNPVYSDDQHGISVSGVAAARGGNGIGVTGAAPYASLAGLRLDFNTGSDAQFVDATLYHSSGSNTNIKIKNHSYGISVPYIPTDAERSAFATSAATGTIHCLAAGNERGTPGEDSNTKHIQSSPDVITVAALGSDGRYASYSCFGACVFVTAPSNSSGYYGITTTDRTGESYGYNGSADSFPDSDYTSQFGGTSSATPLTAGVMALVKQVQPALNVRFAKHLLARTCDVVDASDTTTTSDGGWKTNGAGFKFNQNYGFGLMDADELTQKVLQYAGVTSLTSTTTGVVAVNAGIPDNNVTGVTRTFALSATRPLEEVLVHLNITHTFRGDIEARLTSPHGTTSRLMIQAADSDDVIDWTYCSNAFWGESATGTWTLKVADVAPDDVGTWQSYVVTVRTGDLIPATQAPPTITQHPTSQTLSEGDTAIFTVQATGGAPLAYQWQKNRSDVSNGGRISGATSATLQITNIDSSDTGNYRCVVSNPYGSATSNEATLVITIPWNTLLTEDFESGQDSWTMNNGTWATVNTGGGHGQSWVSPDGLITRASKSFAAGASNSLRLSFEFYTTDASQTQRCWGGLQNVGTNQTPIVDGAMARIGTNNLPNYAIHYLTTTLQVVDTGVSLASGWHSAELTMTLSTQTIDWKLDSAFGSVINPELKRPNGVVIGYNYSNGSAGSPDTSMYIDNIHVESQGTLMRQLTTSVVGGHGTLAPPSGPYPDGTVVNLAASPDGGYRVAQWTGTDNDTLKTNANTVTMSTDKTATVAFELAPVPPEVTGAQSTKVHGSAGTFGVDVLAGAATECRAGGPTVVLVTFDQAIRQVAGTNADVHLSSGTVASLSVAGTQLTIQMSAAADAAKLTISFPGIAAAGDPSVVVTGTVCFGVLLGDANSDSSVNILDLVTIRNTLNLAAGAGNFRSDINADGTINILDLVATRNNLNQAVGGQCQ